MSGIFDRPRVVLVTRKTPLELLLERFGTWGQVRFHVESHGQSVDRLEAMHARVAAALHRVTAAIPIDQRRTRVDRDQLDRFLFAPDDLIVIVGQDGLVPNVAKYLDGQVTIGVNPDPENYDGVLCPHRAEQFESLLGWIEQRDARYALEHRVMAQARREDGQTLLALNEVFVGHGTHQSARYRLRCADAEERQSSSGMIVATGTGSTGWARSIAEQRGIEAPLPQPEERRLAWFVREPFPSVATGTSLDFGELGPGDSMSVVSEMGEGGVAFADGIEADRVEFLAGQTLTIGIAERTLNLVVAAD